MRPEKKIHSEQNEITFPYEIQALDVTKGNSCCSSEVMVGSRLRRLRHEQGLSIRSLAEKCGLSMNTLSLVENNRTSPSVHTLNLLANGLGVPLVTLFEQEKIEPTLVYQHAGERQAIRFANGTAEKLGQGLPPLGAEPIVVTLDVDSRNSEEISHEGREFIYCLEGEVTCLVCRAVLCPQYGGQPAFRCRHAAPLGKYAFRPDAAVGALLPDGSPGRAGGTPPGPLMD